MPVEKTSRVVVTLISEINQGEIKLPEIQRGYVWKATQVAKLIESMYLGYPAGSLLFWKTADDPITRAVAIGSAPASSVVMPLYLLDGQQRLTSLHRVFNDHPEAQVVFNVETEKFQNQSAATQQDPQWVKVYDVVKPDADAFTLAETLTAALPGITLTSIGKRLTRLLRIRDREFHMEILTEFDYEEIAEIFVRVNSGGRALKTTDLVLATLSARWPGVLGKLEEEAAYWAKRHYGDLDVTFLTRALAGAVIGSGLSTGAHGKLIKASDDELDKGLETVKRGLRHLVPLLKENMRVTNSGLMTSHNVLLPLIVLLGERTDAPMDAETANGILYWFLVATIHNRYSSATDTQLSNDIPATRQPEPVEELLRNMGVVGTRVEITSRNLVGRTVGSPYFFLSYLVAKMAEAKDWWSGAEISATAEGGQKLEYHHIHPQATLKQHSPPYGKTEINDLANLAFISGKANRKISDRSPSAYFVDTNLPPLGEDELARHFVPYDEPLRHAAAYPDFLTARRELLATAMTKLLDKFRPAWLDEAAIVADQLAGCSLEFQHYESSWDTGRIVATAIRDDATWTASLSAPDLESSLEAASEGLDSDLDIAGEPAPVHVDNDTLEIPIGPFQVSGTVEAWHHTLERGRGDALPLSQCPAITATPWEGNLVPFPISSVE